MTSHQRYGKDTYNGEKAPNYNVLSYTWGRFQQPGGGPSSLPINGIHWPIPAIKPDIFTPTTFRLAMEHASQGRYHKCAWLWVDIACIPQHYAGEESEAKGLRNKEIGRQMGIFQISKDAFAWLHSLKKSDLRRDGICAPVITSWNIMERIRDAAGKMSEGETSTWSSTKALEFLHRLDQDSRDLQHWVTKLLEHPWFTSLWTLQEMALRPDAYILLDDGVPQYGDTVLDIMMLRGIIYDIRDTLDTSSTAATIRDAVQRASHTQQAEPLRVFNETKFADRLKSIELLYSQKGLLDVPMGISFPNPVYGAAMRREVSRTIDRILGIMQVFKISCNPEPPGHNEMAQLRHLEDEFGQKLVAMDPVLSQLFTHVASSPPRRSWLITQGCFANDKFWTDIASRAQGRNFFEAIETGTAAGQSEVNLHFKGQACSLLDFVHALSPTSTIPHSQDNNLFSTPFNRAHPEGYFGLVLDHHISRTVLGEEIYFFPSSEAMYAAARTIDDKYRLQVQGDGRLHYDETSGTTRHAVTVTVAPLAFHAFSDQHTALTYNAVGLVLAPVHPHVPCITEQGEFSRSPSLSTLKWTRLGLIRWKGDYADLRKTHGCYYRLPDTHDFDAIVV